MLVQEALGSQGDSPAHSSISAGRRLIVKGEAIAGDLRTVCVHVSALCIV